MILNERLAIYLPTTRKRDYLLRNTWISKERFFTGAAMGKENRKTAANCRSSSREKFVGDRFTFWERVFSESKLSFEQLLH